MKSKRIIILIIVLGNIINLNGQTDDHRIFLGSHFGLNYFGHLNNYRTSDLINTGIYGIDLKYVYKANRLIANGGLGISSNRFYFETTPTQWNDFFYRQEYTYKSIWLKLVLEYMIFDSRKSSLSIHSGIFFEPAFSYDVTEYYLNEPPLLHKNITIYKKLGVKQSIGLTFRRKMFEKFYLNAGASICRTLRSNFYQERYPEFELPDDKYTGVLNFGIEYVLPCN